MHRPRRQRSDELSNRRIPRLVWMGVALILATSFILASAPVDASATTPSTAKYKWWVGGGDAVFTWLHNGSAIPNSTSYAICREHPTTGNCYASGKSTLPPGANGVNITIEFTLCSWGRCHTYSSTKTFSIPGHFKVEMNYMGIRLKLWN